MATAWVITKRYQGIFVGGSIYTADVGLSKTFHRKLNCTLSFNDVFRSFIVHDQFTVNGVSSDGRYYDDGREFSIAVKYSIGRTIDSKFKNKEVDDNAGRIK